MEFIRWFRCTDGSCHCHVIAASHLWPVPPSLPELANHAIVRTVHGATGIAPALGFRAERTLIRELTTRLRAETDGALVRACPWQLAREVLADSEHAGVGRARPLNRPGMTAA